MDNEKYILSMITEAGDAKSCLFEAVECAFENEWEKAEELRAEANRHLSNAHNLQTELIQQELSGNRADAGLLMIHAQDHVFSAVDTRELVNIILRMQKEIQELRGDKQ